MAHALIMPNPDYERSYREYIRELGEEERYPFPLDFDHSDFGALLDRLADFDAGRDLPAGSVASSTYWLVQSCEILGVSNLRHCLNDEIRHCGGHIGLGIRPSQRGRGLGTELMSLTVKAAWKRGIDALHVHCHRSNGASARMIRSTGGVLHSEIRDERSARIVQRFVIQSPAGDVNATAG